MLEQVLPFTSSTLPCSHCTD